jgi:hypothetical protein
VQNKKLFPCALQTFLSQKWRDFPANNFKSFGAVLMNFIVMLGITHINPRAASGRERNFWPYEFASAVAAFT